MPFKRCPSLVCVCPCRGKGGTLVPAAVLFRAGDVARAAGWREGDRDASISASVGQAALSLAEEHADVGGAAALVTSFKRVVGMTS